MLYRFIAIVPVLIAFLIVAVVPTYASEALTPLKQGLEEVIASLSMTVVLVASGILALLTLISLKVKTTANIKKLLFLSFVAIVTMTTLFLAVSTIYLNTVSSSKGPVHWHADMEVWNCGKELDFENPTGLSNKIGTATLHEHNDKRIHLEGVVVEPSDASLGKFFKVIGGSITTNSLVIPATDGLITLHSGQNCNNTQAELQVFVFSVDENNRFSQHKVLDPMNYIIAPFSTVPSGECIIIEFDTPKDRTERLCRSYKVAETLGKIQKKGDYNYGN